MSASVDKLIPELLNLLAADAVPPGGFLVELREGMLLLWRITEGEPTDGALDPAPGWSSLPAESPAVPLLWV